MHRDFNFSNSYYNNHPSNQPPGSRQDIHFLSSESKKQGESELVVFNGEKPIRDLYGLQQHSSKTNLAFVPQRVSKSPSQKAFPIIYNAYNDGGEIQPQIKLQNLTTNYNSKPQRNQYTDFEQYHESNQQTLSFKLPQYRPQQVHQTNEIHTFQQIPESEPNTAKFIHPSEKTLPEHYFMASQTQPYRPPSEIYFEQRQISAQSPPHPQPTQIYNAQSSHSTHLTIPQHRNESRVTNQPPYSIPHSNRVTFQEQPQRFIPNQSQERQRLVSIPQEEYERYQQYLLNWRKNQDQSVLARTKIEQLSQKQHFYWQQNMTLRQQNKRLRDLVNHFQKRQKQLLLQRQETAQNFEAQITKYQDSTLEQLKLLLERYKLEMQRKK